MTDEQIRQGNAMSYKDTNPVVRNFWESIRNTDTDFHIFKKNWPLVFFGNKLANQSYDHIVDRMNHLEIEYNHAAVLDYNGVCGSMVEMSTREAGHTKELEELAVKAVSGAFSVPEDLLRPSLNEDADISLNETGEDEEDFNYESLSQEIKDQINKRILLNCVIQGSSIHSFYTLHHLVKDEIENIDPELIEHYDMFSVGSVRSYFDMDYSSMLEDSGMARVAAMGSAEVVFDEETDQAEVVANAVSFPVLCQELTKGAVELIAMHGLKDLSKEELKQIYYFADQRADEPRYIQIGSEVWRNILEINKICKKDIPELIMEISLMPPDEICRFFDKLFEKGFDSVAYDFLGHRDLR